MATPEFVLEHLEQLPPQCRLCDNLLNFVETTLLPLYEAGKIDEEMVREDMYEATNECGGFLRFVSTLPESPIEEKDCYFGTRPVKKRLVTED